MRRRKPSQKLKMSEVFAAIKSKLPPLAAKFVIEQLQVSTKKKNGLRWSDFTQSICLQLKSASPKAYKILRKIFTLPGKTTLTNILNKVSVVEGWHQSVLFALTHASKGLSNMDKMVTITFDEMSLKQNVSYNAGLDRVEGLDKNGQMVNHAGVFMMRSVSQNWKQPFGYFLSSKTVNFRTLKERLVESVRQVRRTGFIPVCVIMDQGSNNCAAVRLLGVTKDKPYFEVDGDRVYFIYDPPHLMKNVRNNFKRHGFFVRGKLADWSHIRELYKQDSRREIRMCPKLTSRHLDLSAFLTMSVSLATQV